MHRESRKRSLRARITRETLRCTGTFRFIFFIYLFFFLFIFFFAILSKCCFFCDFLFAALGPVVQSIVSLTSSLRGQLVKCFTTL